MSIRILKKALGLLIVYIVIIIGIFVLQFRTDSSIIKKIGGLQVTLAQTENGNSTILKNSLRITYNGLNIYCDDQNPAILTSSENQNKEIQLINYEIIEPLSFRFFFTDDVTLLVSLSSEEAGARLSAAANLPDGTTRLSIPFSFTSNTKITSEDSSHVIIAGKKDSWEVQSSAIHDNMLSFTPADAIASYSIFTETKKFSFEAIADLPLADSQTYQRNITTFKNNLIAAFHANSVESNISEQVAISYIATMAERNQYSQALEEIPQSLKRGKQKTFLSAPYFGSLEEMNEQLEISIRDYERRITESANSDSLDIFTVSNISSFISIHSSPAASKRLLQKVASANLENATIAQVTGIIQVYVDLVKMNPEYAEILKPAMDGCIERITDACSFENNVLTISENDTFLSVIQAVETGIAILRYGLLSGNSTLQKAGYVLVNSYMTEASSFDLRTLANLFPILAYNNTYIPHFEIIKAPDNGSIIVWTCTKSINFEKEADGSSTLSIDFGEGDTQYLILRGIPQFTKIYIYDMQYRTDPRFETYNSSGYVYKPVTNTLLLKSRHKTAREVIRFEYN